MIKIKGVLNVPGQYIFYCPGCESHHAIYVQGEYLAEGPKWSWNNNKESPTFSPSLLISFNLWSPPVTPENIDEWERNPWEQKEIPIVCHSFINNGNIQFLQDCTHKLAGQTVPLPDID